MSERRNNGKIHLVRHLNAHWRVTFDIPPLNMLVGRMSRSWNKSCHRSKPTTASTSGRLTVPSKGEAG
jgi:hypothetical protein